MNILSIFFAFIQDRFSAPSRFILATQLEIGIQADHVRKGVIWIFQTIVKVIKGTIRVTLSTR
jgi:hypothetical protein